MKKLLFLVSALLVLTYSCKKNTPAETEEDVKSDSDTNVIVERFSNGKIKTEISAVGELRQGWTRNYDREGRLLSEVFYVNNVREGTARNFYAETGKVNSSLEYKNGIKVGDEIWYYESGSKYRVSPFVNGQIEGIQRLYYEDGKLMAEIPYKAGWPGIGLKEYKPDGTLINDYPKLIITKEDHMKGANKVLLMISLSNNAPEAKFYKGPLTEGKYLNNKILLLAIQNGIAQIDYNIPPGAAINQKVTITANIKTPRGTPLILSRTYSLQVSNN